MPAPHIANIWPSVCAVLVEVRSQQGNRTAAVAVSLSMQGAKSV